MLTVMMVMVMMIVMMVMMTWPTYRPLIHVCFPGLFSNIMRELANLSHTGPKWIVLDGDIDPMWIESLNTVMDDNKVCVCLSPCLCFSVRLCNNALYLSLH